jgi:indole-3-glycerol phosphate synthase
MSDLLAAAVASARRSADERERTHGDIVRARAAARTDARPGVFAAALGEPGIRVIAECKRRSPSRGVLRARYDPAAIAAAYDANGAAAISVLTEPTFFDGTLDHLRAVRRVTSRPILRKDFVVTAFQIVEAADAGADAVLLIVRALEDAALRTLIGDARAAGLDALVEVHDRPELDRALAAGATIVGVNCRNLNSLAVDRGVFDALAPHLPDEVVAVAESGLESAADLQRLAELRYDAFLVGERLVTERDPGAALSALLAAAGVGGRA